MVGINVFDYIKDLSNSKFEAKSFEETKKDLEELYEYDVILEDLENNFFAPKNSININNDVFMQTSSLISEIKKKQEIKDRLISLSYSVGWLKTAILIKDENIANKAIKSIIKNDYSSISVIVLELNTLKNKIDELESLHINLLKSGLSLDTKTLLEQNFKEKHEKLNNLYNKQRNILLNLSNIFVKLTKEFVIKKN